MALDSDLTITKQPTSLYQLQYTVGLVATPIIIKISHGTKPY